MKKHFEYNKVIRDNYINFIKSYTEEQLHTIPLGYNNNIFWNIAHVIATQQAICYLLPKATPVIPEEFIKEFRKGTTPKKEHKEKFTPDLLIEYLQLTSQKLNDDYLTLKELKFPSYTTSFGTTFDNLEDAIIFNNVHEGLHFGYILSLKNAL